jgi:hypothetical protein
MPYIKDELRSDLDIKINELASEILSQTKIDQDVPGLLNYCITRLILKLIVSRFGKLRYWIIPTIRGVLADVSDEFYRRLASPYEDLCITKNGDVDLYKEFSQEIADEHKQIKEKL